MLLQTPEDDVPEDAVIETLASCALSMDDTAEFTVYAHKVVTGANAKKVRPASNPIVWVPEDPGADAEFRNDNIGQWLVPKIGPLPKTVSPTTIPSFEGVVRSAFAVAFRDLSLEPIKKNPLCIFTSRAVQIPGQSLFVLH